MQPLSANPGVMPWTRMLLSISLTAQQSLSLRYGCEETPDLNLPYTDKALLTLKGQHSALTTDTLLMKEWLQPT